MNMEKFLYLYILELPIVILYMLYMRIYSFTHSTIVKRHPLAGVGIILYILGSIYKRMLALIFSSAPLLWHHFSCADRDRRRKEISPLLKQSGRRQDRGRINQLQYSL